jgi:PhnB protein
MAVKSIPEGHHSVTPYLVVDDVARLIDFVKRAFQAVEFYKMQRPDGKIGHAELKIGDSMIMMWWITTHIEDVSSEEIARRVVSKR